MNGATAVWIFLVLSLALLTIPSILTLRTALAWASSWTVVGMAGAYVGMRFRNRRRE